ncbi:MAG: glyoxalase/bleomycin resistance/extradiol dioxygenase family protein [Verrucomicrobia bacterium]|nr:glyoxalase/bleomycin resistance/extradiol dioxygenase family protein [Verrucomicrobiota bacterium]
MIHHLSLPVTNIKRSAAFYDAALGTLGYKRFFSRRNVIGYGEIDNGDIFSIRLRPKEKIMSGDGFIWRSSAARGRRSMISMRPPSPMAARTTAAPG